MMRGIIHYEIVTPAHSMPVPGNHAPSLRFVCRACKASLVVTESQSGVSGPCPSCSTWIDASDFSLLDTPDKVPAAGNPPRHRRSQSATPGRGSIRADGYLDHDHSERKELFVTLRVLAVSMAVLAVILFVTLYMKQWMAQ